MEKHLIKLVETWAPMLDGFDTDAETLTAAHLINNLDKQLKNSFKDEKVLGEMRKTHIPLTRRLIGKIFGNSYLIQISDKNNSINKKININYEKKIITNDLIEEGFEQEAIGFMIDELFMEVLYANIVLQAKLFKNIRLQVLMSGYSIIKVNSVLYSVFDEDTIII